MITELLRDLEELAVAASSPGRRATRLAVLTRTDSIPILWLHRLPRTRLGRRIPLLRWATRRMLAMVYGMELGADVQLGPGVFFVHPQGIIVGGDARVGARVRFYGDNTVGTAKDNGYPVIDEDVRIGCGARVLGPVHIGARAVIGANAVVLSDVPPDQVVAGVPARVVGQAGAAAAGRPA
ncbi:MAG: serine acetyltransferase [Deltaproteobacteria bacterium]|nr:serine acetyltransferase [Deltaproteobacteria bacterium]